MQKRYWYDLSNEERNELLQEWHKSTWCKNVKVEKIPKIPSFFAYHLYLIINCFLAIETIGAFFYAILYFDKYDEAIIWLVPFISSIPLILCSVYLQKIRNQQEEEMYEKEAARWLLVHHNIVK